MNKTLILLLPVIIVVILFSCNQITGKDEGSGGGDDTVSIPVIDIPGGTYSEAQAVTITTETEGATIKYTKDDSDPLTSTSFSIGTPGTAIAEVTIGKSCTLKTYAYMSGVVDSPVAETTYNILSSSAGPDYAVSTTVYPLNVVPSSPMEGSFRISNIGLAGTDSITWTVSVSSDGASDSGDTILQTGTASALPVGGQSGIITFSGNWPANPTGYYIIISLSAADDFITGNNTEVSSLVPLGVTGRFVAVGNAGHITYSDDGGATWNTVNDIDVGASVLRGITRAEDTNRLVAVGSSAIGDAIVFYSDDGGINWTPSVVPVTEDLMEVIWCDDSIRGKIFIAVGTDRIIYSTDPSVLWTIAATVPARDYRDIAFGADTFSAVHTTVNALSTSTDGAVTWVNEDTGIAGTTSFLYGIIYTGTHYVAAGKESTIERFYQSADNGETWTILNPAGVAAGALWALAYDGSVNILAVGDNGRIWISSNNGTSWGLAAGAVLPDSDLKGVIYGDGVWIVTGTAVTGNIWRTTNPAAAWTAIDEGANTLNDVVFIP